MQKILYISPLVLAFVLSGGIATYTWRRRGSTNGATQFALLMVAIFLWDTAYLCELFVSDLTTALLLTNVEYVGIVTIPVLWLIYVLHYIGHERWLTIKRQVTLFIIPGLTLVFLLTNNYHELMRSDISYETSGLFPNVIKTYGLWFWVHTGYSYILLLVASFLILRSAFYSTGLLFGQKFLLLLSVLLPWTGNALYIFNITALDLTPPAFSLMGLVVLLDVARFQFLNIIPVARDAVIENMADAVVVLNMQNRVVDANPASEKIINLPAAKIIGMGAADLFAAQLDVINRYANEWEAHDEIVVEVEPTPVYYDLQITPLKNRSGRLVGRLLVMRDITSRKQSEEALQKLNEELERRIHERTAELMGELTARSQVEEALRVSDERYSLAMHGANDGLWDWDMQKDVLYYSPRWKAMLGYAEDEVGISQNEWFDRIHPDDVHRVRSEILRHFQNPQADLFNEYRMIHKNGEIVWVLCRGIAIKDEKGLAYRMAGSITDITLRKQSEEQARHNAFHDNLTGLANRSLFTERLNHSIERAKRNERNQFAVLYLDLDRFKNINDSLGHTEGDRLLIECGKRLVLSVRTVDMVARFGGDEFVILIEDIETIHDAIRVAERIQNEMAHQIMLPEYETFITVSIGIVKYAPIYDRAEEILRDADVAMYQAKFHGAARYAIFDTEMRRRAVTRLELETDLRKALDRGELILNYQPIIEIKSNRLVGFEALIRWQHPQRGLIPPLDFIPIAEETGMIAPLGRWVLREACMQICSWQKQYPEMMPIVVHVNLSTKQFSQPDLRQMIEQVLIETQLHADRLTLEITESALIEDYEMAIDTLQILRQLGVQVEIDDFGTGYSSLAYLHRLPIDALKIDRSFISKMCAADDSSAEIVQTIITLARELGLKVVGEGVETAQELEKLRKLGCDYCQGFLFSKPVDSQAAGSLISHWALKENF